MALTGYTRLERRVGLPQYFAAALPICCGAERPWPQGWPMGNDGLRHAFPGGKRLSTEQGNFSPVENRCV